MFTSPLPYIIKSCATVSCGIYQDTKFFIVQSVFMISFPVTLYAAQFLNVFSFISNLNIEKFACNKYNAMHRILFEAHSNFCSKELYFEYFYRCISITAYAG